MDLGEVSEEDLGRTPCIAAGCDPTALRLSASEGYLLSRIDGHTPWRLLREIGGLTADEVDMCVEMWLGDGVIEMGEVKRRPVPPPPPPLAASAPPTPPRTPGQIDEGEIDDSLDLGLDTQRRILEMESRLGCGYPEILGVAPDADGKAIKKAYRGLSRDFHPDRYFRKQIGDFKPRLEAIFKKVLEAYELLSDPSTRMEIQKAMAEAASASAANAPPDPNRPLTPIERLRMRMPFKIPEAMLRERRERARKLYDSARSWAENDHHLEAASSIRLAIAFDPFEELYKTTFAEIQAGFFDVRIAQLLTDSKQWAGGDWEQGLQECEEMLLYRPHDPELNLAAAAAALGLRRMVEARDYVDCAIEHSPDVGRYHAVLAKVLAGTGDRGHAIKELQLAVELDPSNREAVELLEKLSPRRVAHGGSE